ncbi:MAG TPA: hypothetical protein VKK79_03115 [Candidatus Lokiarchaeia archaeon]|nr:hypothetical protein [Candidatus Lokiarchaeia archaeon]
MRMKSRTLFAIICLATTALVVIQVATVAPQGKADRPTTPTNIVIFSWGSSTPLLTSLGLDRVGNGGAAFNYSNDAIITPDNYGTNFYKIDWNSISVVIVDGFLPNNIDIINTIMNQVNGSVAKKGLLFFGANYSLNAGDDIITAFSKVLPGSFVANRATKNASIDTGFQNITGEAPGTFDLVSAYMNYSMTQIKEYNILGQTQSVEVAINPAVDTPGFLFTSPRIAWGSCPLLGERIQTFAPVNNATDTVLVQVPSTLEPLIIMRNETDQGRVMYFSPGTFVQNETWNGGTLDAWNKPFYLWPYFNYLMYLTVRWLDPAVNPNTIESYADWPYSPIPHVAEATLWIIFCAGLWVFNFFLFFILGKKSRRPMEGTVVPEEGSPEAVTETSPEWPDLSEVESLPVPERELPGGPSGPSGPSGPRPNVKPEPEIPPKPEVDEDVDSPSSPSEGGDGEE